MLQFIRFLPLLSICIHRVLTQMQKCFTCLYTILLQSLEIIYISLGYLNSLIFGRGNPLSFSASSEVIPVEPRAKFSLNPSVCLTKQQFILLLVKNKQEFFFLILQHLGVIYCNIFLPIQVTQELLFLVTDKMLVMQSCERIFCWNVRNLVLFSVQEEPFSAREMFFCSFRCAYFHL